MIEKIFSVWEGVYNSFAEAGGDFDVWDSEIWIAKQLNRTSEAIEKYKSGSLVSKDYPLSLIVAMELCKNDKLSVLDFGGGMGLQYLEVISKVPEAIEKLDYYIIDGKSSIENRPSELDHFQKLHFFDSLDAVEEKIDIIHIGSTLQYIEDWQGLLTELQEKYSPRLFVFSDLMAGDIPTFVSHQIFYEKRMPIIMFNLSNFIDTLVKIQYKLLYQTLFQVKILESNELPNRQLPEKYRIKHTVNLVFCDYETK